MSVPGPVRSPAASTVVTLLVGLITGAAPVFGQGTLGATSSAFAEEPPVAADMRPSPGRPVLAQNADESPFRWGGLIARPRLAYHLDYGDGILARPGESVDTALHQFTAGIEVALGDYWTLDYAARWNEYSAEHFKDQLDHVASIAGVIPLADWRVAIRHQFTTASPALVETARQTKQETHVTDFVVSRLLTDRFSADVAATQNLRFVEATPDVYDWSVIPALNYRAMTGLEFSASCAVGYAMLIRSPDVVYYRPQLGAIWALTDKLTLDTYGGAEIREFIVGPAPDMVSPIYGLSLEYQPFPQTSISAEIGKQLSASYFAGLTTESTQWSLRFRQRLLGRLNFSASYSFQNADFISAVRGLPVAREDEREMYRFGLDLQILKRGRIGLSYRENYNDSSLPGYSTSTSVIGFDLSYRY